MSTIKPGQKYILITQDAQDSKVVCASNADSDTVRLLLTAALGGLPTVEDRPGKQTRVVTVDQVN